MWNINERFDSSILETQLPAAGFIVSSTGGVARVEKYGCAAEFRRTSDGRYQMTVPPSVLINGQFARLWDAGYQKFLLADDGRKFPALASQLANLQALGSTCQVTTYDRLKGRVGDVPDPIVGAKSPKGH